MATNRFADEADRLGVVGGGRVELEHVERVVDVAQLLERAELGQLGCEFGAVGRVERVLMLKLGGQQLQEGIFIQAVGCLREACTPAVGRS